MFPKYHNNILPNSESPLLSTTIRPTRQRDRVVETRNNPLRKKKQTSPVRSFYVDNKLSIVSESKSSQPC